MSLTVDVLVVGGGGSGGGYTGAGGGGDVIRNASLAVTVGAYAVVVGAGGVGISGAASTRGNNGGDSTFGGITALGGGGGGANSDNSTTRSGKTGGSGGGGAQPSTFAGAGSGGSASGTNVGAGGDGYSDASTNSAGGGGGGAGAAGASAPVQANSTGGNGGVGKQFSTFASVAGSPAGWFSGGGGGGTDTSAAVGTCGNGGGGHGGNTSAGPANGVANSGGGGGGCNSGAYTSGAGGSGVVVISYADGSIAGATGGTITSTGGTTFHTFTTSGTFTITGPLLPFDWPNPTLRTRPTDRFGYLRTVNLPLFFYVPPRPIPLLDWPNPVRRKNAPAWQQSVTQSLCIPRDADYFYAYVWITIDGVARAQGRVGTGQVDYDSLTVTDIIDQTPNTCTFIARGFTPTAGMSVVITLGSATVPNPERIFAGNILNVEQTYSGTPANQQFLVSCIDWTWQLNKVKVIREYSSQTATAIAINLIATYAPGFTCNHVALLDTIDLISFTNEDLTAALTQLAKRVGGYWYVDYLKDLHFFVTEPAAAPIALTASHPSLSAFSVKRDLSQWFTRAFSEGGGASALENGEIGETILPLQTVDWYEDGGGAVTTGRQRLTYAGRVAGGVGTIAGPGAAPVAAPGAALLAGTGIESGVHDYAYTWVTGSGESLPSPLGEVTCAPIAATTSTLSSGLSTIGNGPEVGSHDYAVTFTAAGGETTPGPLFTKTTPVGSPPAAALTVGTVTPGGSVDDGNHDYEFTYVNNDGESTPSGVAPGSAGAVQDPPSNSPGLSLTGSGPNPTAGVYRYSVTFYNAAGETVGAAYTSIDNSANPGTINLASIAVGPTGTIGRRLYRTSAGTSSLRLLTDIANNSATTYSDSIDSGSLGANIPTTNTAAQRTIPLSNITTGPSGTIARNVYRRPTGSGLAFKLAVHVGDNSSTTANDTVANASLGATAPSVNTFYQRTNALSAIPVSLDANVTGRKIYRTALGSSQLKLLGTLGDNSTTTYTDTTADAALGANVPSSNSTHENQVAVSGIAVGPSGTTSRKVYRTAAGASQLKLLSTIANNTGTTLTDSTADASLGANAPTSDTSGLTKPDGQILPGAATMLTAGLGGFPASGWVITGNGQIIRYTGVSSNTLTGIPASGTGAVLSTIPYATMISVAPQLTGIPASGTGSILYTIIKGDQVNLLAQADDLVGQVDLSALLDPSNLLSGAAGIVEDYQQDGRISHTEALARAEARLALRGALDESIVYGVRDPKTASGKTISVNLPSPTSVAADYQIQKVTITAFRPSASLFPTYTAEASSVRFSFEDLLRNVIEGTASNG